MPLVGAAVDYTSKRWELGRGMAIILFCTNLFQIGLSPSTWLTMTLVQATIGVGAYMALVSRDPLSPRPARSRSRGPRARRTSAAMSSPAHTRAPPTDHVLVRLHPRNDGRLRKRDSSHHGRAEGVGDALHHPVPRRDRRARNRLLARRPIGRRSRRTTRTSARKKSTRPTPPRSRSSRRPRRRPSSRR